MDPVTLVADRINGGRRFITRFAADGHPVRAAFWARTADEGLWYLHVATQIVDGEGPAAAYRAVHATLRKLPEVGIPSSEIKAESPDEPLVQDVLAILSRYPGRLTESVRGRAEGAAGSDAVYIYPTHLFKSPTADSMTAEDLGREILRLMGRGPGLLQPSRVVLKDGTQFDGSPFSVQLGNHQAMVVQFVADGEVAPRVVGLDDIASIR